MILHVAVPSPLRTPLDYLLPEDMPLPLIGSRVRVPLGRRQLVGVVMGHADSASVASARLRPVTELLDPEPLLDEHLLKLAQWTADYYQHPIGEVVHQLLPVLRRRQARTAPRTRAGWQLTPSGRGLDPATLSGTPAQQRALEHLQQHAAPQPQQTLNAAGISTDSLRRLADRNLVSRVMVAAAPRTEPTRAAAEQPLTPNREQARAIAAICSHRSAFSTFLLQGVTGSGKTEVYLQVLEQVLQDGRQILLLVPEIGLTPQTVSRVQARFGDRVGLLHSGLSDRERLQHWERARRGQLRILVGTRSAIFAPLPELGLILVDEEHDEAYKQQDGLRYSARDLAVMRAHMLDIPVVLGSATPSLESLHNADCGRYQLLQLSHRAGGARAPDLQLVDLNRQVQEGAFARPVLESMARTLAEERQVLVFLNRRGFAPVLMCQDCGWIAECRNCDARLTVHQQQGGRLQCHHCGHRERLPERCPSCDAPTPMPVGQGTQRAEQLLQARFPEVPVLRIDRDSTRSSQRLHETLEQIGRGGAAVLVGTQMLAKGHHFPDVTLVVVVNADGGLFSADFRSSERLAQLLLQVAGRAGRDRNPGRVLIQTQHPDHPLWEPLLAADYSGFAAVTLAERQQLQLPPFGYLALLRAASTRTSDAEQFLERCADCLADTGLQVMGPVPALLERRQGRFRWQLLLQSHSRPQLQQALRSRIHRIDALRAPSGLRWSLDVDPADLL